MPKKYFIAIVPPENTLQKIEGIKQELFEEYGLKGALRSPAHITLHRPFEWKEEKEKILVETLAKFSTGPSFSIKLKNFNCFTPRVIYVDLLRNEELDTLHKQLMHFAGSKLKLLNELEDTRGFHPHVTIAFRDLKKKQFFELWKTFEARVFSEKFDYSGFCLLKLDKKWEILKKFTI